MSTQGACVPLIPHGCAGEPLSKDWGAKGGVQGEGLGLRGRFPTHSRALGVAPPGEPGPGRGVSRNQQRSLWGVGLAPGWVGPATVPLFSVSHLSQFQSKEASLAPRSEGWFLQCVSCQGHGYG